MESSASTSNSTLVEVSFHLDLSIPLTPIQTPNPLKFYFNICKFEFGATIPSKLVFHQKSSCIKGPLPSKVVIHHRSSFIQGCFPSRVVFHQRSSSIKGHQGAYGWPESRVSLFEHCYQASWVTYSTSTLKTSET